MIGTPAGDREALPGLTARVRARLARHGGELTPQEVAAAVRAEGVVLGAASLLELVDALRAELVGLGPLEAVLRTPGTTDVLVNGGGAVWCDRGEGLVRVAVDLGGEAGARALAVRLAAGAGRRLDDASPCVDGRLPDGTRLHAVLPPVSPEGTHLSLRVPAATRFGLDDLVAAGAIPDGWAPVLRAVVEQRLSFLVSGGTGAGKTTVLEALLGQVGPGERIVLVEDAGELRPAHPHVVRLEARRPNVEGRGEVPLEVLVRQALRMRPDRLVVGECRGPEVRDLLAALNTGHAGAGTVHANTSAHVVARLQALGALAGMAPAAVDAQFTAAVDVVLHVQRDRRGRRLREVAVVGGDGGAPLVQPALLDGPSERTTAHGWQALARRLGLDPGRPPGARAGVGSRQC
ncbi:pilus assembly protein CpaF [Kineococcus xinjiangensis]|uniref:Pilus assembly protein CpaF n=1 Tax=Kineococcus xinjiangensis TaxID=512762 RepID=A0A2S6IFD9_9ACTN|nr:TadA family conjugal transfer-associated ATPase [Kineococcus xinjiangensis]PPK92928.1 pilus assembly protein CpaF [Kineococcus xinjiangensis]